MSRTLVHVNAYTLCLKQVHIYIEKENVQNLHSAKFCEKAENFIQLFKACSTFSLNFASPFKTSLIFIFMNFEKNTYNKRYISTTIKDSTSKLSKHSERFIRKYEYHYLLRQIPSMYHFQMNSTVEVYLNDYQLLVHKMSTKRFLMAKNLTSYKRVYSS